MKQSNKRTLADAEGDIERLKAQLLVCKQECEFWTDQARNLQNHLQTVMRGQANMLEQMARSSMTADDVQACVEFQSTPAIAGGRIFACAAAQPG